MIVRSRAVSLSLITLACVLAQATPVPSEAEMETARPAVEKLAAADFADLRAKRKTHSDVAAAFEDYAAAAESPAARYLYERAAFRQCLHGGDVAGAKRLVLSVAERHGSAYALEMARFGVSALTKLVLQKTEGAKEFRDLLAAVNARVKDPACAAMIGFERDYPLTGVTPLACGDLGDFWWLAADEAKADEAVVNAFRAHAAAWYRRALANRSLRAQNRAAAQRRIAEAEAASAAETASAESSAAAVEGVAPAAGVAAEAAAPSTNDVLKVFSLPLARNLDLEFRLPMGSNYKNWPANRLLTPFHVTYEQYRNFRKIPRFESGMASDRSSPVRVMLDEADDFCKWLVRRYRSKLPPDATVRLPIDSELPGIGGERNELVKGGVFRGPARFMLVLELSGAKGAAK